MANRGQWKSWKAVPQSEFQGRWAVVSSFLEAKEEQHLIAPDTVPPFDTPQKQSETRSSPWI